jgi:hypothetical protein
MALLRSLYRVKRSKRRLEASNMIVNHPYFYSRKTCMNSAAKRVIAALSLTALVASCGSNPASYTQFAGPVSQTAATDATDFN